MESGKCQQGEDYLMMILGVRWRTSIMIHQGQIMVVRWKYVSSTAIGYTHVHWVVGHVSMERMLLVKDVRIVTLS